MAMKYQKGTVYLSGQKVKMWYGKYLVYRKNQDGKEVRSHRDVAICPKADTPKWKAQQMLQEVIVKESGGNRQGAYTSARRLGDLWLVCKAAIHSHAGRCMESGL